MDVFANELRGLRGIPKAACVHSRAKVEVFDKPRAAIGQVQVTPCFNRKSQSIHEPSRTTGSILESRTHEERSCSTDHLAGVERTLALLGQVFLNPELIHTDKRVRI